MILGVTGTGKTAFAAADGISNSEIRERNLRASHQSYLVSVVLEHGTSKISSFHYPREKNGIGGERTI